MSWLDSQVKYWIIEVKDLAELSLLKWSVLAGKVCREVVHFELRCKVWFS